MAWQCRLYGHRWRHPGEYEVVPTDGRRPTHPFQCTVCGGEMRVIAGGGDRRSKSVPGDRDSVETDPELDPTSESSLDE